MCRSAAHSLRMHVVLDVDFVLGNGQGKQKDGEPWQEHGVCFSIGKGCAKHPRPVHDET